MGCAGHGRLLPSSLEARLGLLHRRADQRADTGTKPLPDDLASLRPALRRTKVGHREASYDVAGANGHAFRVIIRQSARNPIDFTVILAYLPKDSNRLFHLRRCNGKSHEHTNRLERNSFYGFHVHMATERYQVDGGKEDAYAEPTDRYSDLGGAIDCLVGDGGFRQSADQPPRLL
jgi:hypothetical protein